MDKHVCGQSRVYVVDSPDSRSFTYTIPSNYVAANMHYVAFVMDANGNALNARNAGNNVSQTFEIE